KTNNCDRLVMVWCGSTEVYRSPSAVHASLAAFEKGLVANDPEIAPSQIYAYAALKCGVPYANGAPNLSVDTAALLELAKQNNVPIIGWMGYPMQIKIDFLCRDSILAAPIVLDLALFMDLAQRCGMSGIQEWLSFYWKSPQTAPDLYPEHDLFIQLMKLKNTL